MLLFILFMIAILLSVLLIIKKVKAELNWNKWKSDVNKMSINYIDACNEIERYNNKLYQYRIRIKREINYKQKTRLLELAEIQYTKIQIKSQEHIINHTFLYNYINKKYT